MLEYILFHEKPFNLFCDFLQNNKIVFQTKADNGMFEALISEDTAGDMVEIIEAEYDRLMLMNQEIFFAENETDENNYRMATIMLELKDGSYTSAHVRPDLLGKIMDVISDEELNEFTRSMVTAVENPDDRTYCQKVRAGEVDFKATS